MNNTTVRTRILAGFLLMLVLLLGLSGTGIFSLKSVDKYTDSLEEETLPGLKTLASIEPEIWNAQLCTFRHVIAKDAAAKDKWETEVANIAKKISELMAVYEKAITSEEDRTNFKRLSEARAAYATARKDVLALSEANKTDEAIAALAGKTRETFNAYIDVINVMTDYNNKAAVTSLAEIQGSIHGSLTANYVISGVAVIIAIGACVLITGGLNKSLRALTSILGESASQVSSAATQVSASAQSLAQGASEQAASLEETSSSLEEISSMTKRNAENATNAKALAGQARSAVELGHTDMQAMSAAMSEMQSASQEISKIIKTIDEIAFQTNILALNAAVEAARAGEAGAGFAVVADEVRSLAQRSAVAAKETAGKIETATTKSQTGVELTAKVATRLEEVLTKVRSMDTLMAEIAQSSSEQSQGIEQLNTGVTQMDKVTQSNAASAEESAAAAETLTGQAADLESAVLDLKRLVDGAGNNSAAPKVSSAKTVSGKPAGKAGTRTSPPKSSETVLASSKAAEPKEAFQTIGGSSPDQHFKDFR